jgi:hypothetical protein
MEGKPTKKEEESTKKKDNKSTLGVTSYDAEDVFAGAEPWIPIETKLVVGSFIAAIVSLAIFGTLINIFILK